MVRQETGLYTFQAAPTGLGIDSLQGVTAWSPSSSAHWSL